jgi:hypothetical protein
LRDHLGSQAAELGADVATAAPASGMDAAATVTSKWRRNLVIAGLSVDQCPTSGVLQLRCSALDRVGKLAADRELDHLRAESGSLRVSEALLNGNGH